MFLVLEPFISEEEVEDHSEEGEDEDDENPEEFFDGVHAGLDNRDDGDDVEDEDEERNDEAGVENECEGEVHRRSFHMVPAARLPEWLHMQYLEADL